MNLDRALIKSQAKQLIKGKVFKLFVYIFIVGILTGGMYVVVNIGSFSDLGDLIDGTYDAYAATAGSMSIFSGFAGLGGIVTLVFAPLEISLCLLFLHLVNGRDYALGDGLGTLFKKTFDKNYINKFLLELLVSIVTGLLCLLLIVPGIIYSYKVYFASYIMAENPNLSWKEAVALSKKLTNGHKGELFVLDLSFIPWYFVVAITCGIGNIYVAPYIFTTQALYYENFKQRALQNGEITAADFLTEAERAASFYGNSQQNPTYYPPQQTYAQPQEPQQPCAQPEQPYAQPEQPQYYQPPTEEFPNNE